MRHCKQVASASLIAAALLTTAGTAHGQVFAASGFNDVFGINGDGLANFFPFNINNASLHLQGQGEPNWAQPWLVQGVGRVVNANQAEGDGAAIFTGGQMSRLLVAPLVGTQRVTTALKVLQAGTDDFI